MVATENGSSQEGPLREAIAMASGFRAQASRTRANYGEQREKCGPRCGAVRCGGCMSCVQYVCVRNGRRRTRAKSVTLHFDCPGGWQTR